MVTQAIVTDAHDLNKSTYSCAYHTETADVQAKKSSNFSTRINIGFTQTLDPIFTSTLEANILDPIPDNMF
jgi:hypothetical protein